jgi:hypothetical protein
MPNEELVRFKDYLKNRGVTDEEATVGGLQQEIAWYKEFLVHEGRKWPPEWVTANDPK